MKYGAVGVIYGENQVAGYAGILETTTPDSVSLPAVSVGRRDREKIAAALEEGDTVVVTIMAPGMSISFERIN